MRSWVQVRVETRARRSADVGQWLEDEGALAVSTESALPDRDEAWLQEATEWREPAWRRIRHTGLFDPGCDVEAVVAHLRARLADDPDHDISVDTLADTDWSQAWRAGHEPLRFGSRLVVHAGGYRQAAAETAVVLEPGLAFGTGSHATTAMCLERLAEEPLAGVDVLDFGCGSGILAVAALALGARSALAVDVDPQALEATRANAQRNGVARGLTVCFPRELADEPCADLVIANILANTLVRLAPRLMRLARPGARLWLSGLLRWQVSAVTAAYAPRFEFTEQRRGEWVLLAGQPVQARDPGGRQ